VIKLKQKPLNRIRTGCAATAEIARVGGSRYAVQSHSRSLILIPVKSRMRLHIGE